MILSRISTIRSCRWDIHCGGMYFIGLGAGEWIVELGTGSYSGKQNSGKSQHACFMPIGNKHKPTKRSQGKMYG